MLLLLLLLRQMPRQKRSQRQETSSAAAAAAALSQWVCLTCTWRNEGSASHCAMCEYSRPVDGDDYNCDVCGVTTTQDRYHKDDEDDIDLCPACYESSASEIFKGAVFVRIEQSEPVKTRKAQAKTKAAAARASSSEEGKGGDRERAAASSSTKRSRKKATPEDDATDEQPAAAAAP